MHQAFAALSHQQATCSAPQFHVEYNHCSEIITNMQLNYKALYHTAMVRFHNFDLKLFESVHTTQNIKQHKKLVQLHHSNGLA